MKRFLSFLCAAVIGVSSLSMSFPSKAEAHAEFLVTVGRMASVLPVTVVRGGAFLVEGVLDGVIEGITSRKGFLHGENRYSNCNK